MSEFIWFLVKAAPINSAYIGSSKSVDLPPMHIPNYEPFLKVE